MGDFLLRVEAVNLGQFVYDTNDLSTVRGAGLLLLDAVRSLNEIDGLSLQLTPVTVGASIGLYRLVSDSQSISAVVSTVCRWLDTHPAFRHITFVIAAEPIPDSQSGDDASDESTITGFENAKECLVAHNRWSQFTQPTTLNRANESDWHRSVSSKPAKVIHWADVPTTSDPKIDQENRRREDRLSCSIDMKRPKAVNLRQAGKRIQGVSHATAIRKTAGRYQKQAFYQRLTEDPDLRQNLPAEYATSIAQIGMLPPSATGLGRLNRKIAVIYLDGNDFGKIQREHCQGETKLRTFDELLQSSRSQFLLDYLSEKNQPENRTLWTTSSDDPIDEDDDDFRKDAGEAFQLETLLWGGDEVVWVVPAWQGWDLLGRFLHDWQMETDEEANSLFKGNPFAELSHSGGIVFCNIKTPIHQVTRLAKDLAELAKSETPKANRFAYEILESFDHIGDDLTRHRRDHAPVRVKTDREKEEERQAAEEQARRETLERERLERQRRAERESGGMRNLNAKPRKKKAKITAAPVPTTNRPDKSANEQLDNPRSNRMLLEREQIKTLDDLVRELKRSPDFPKGRLRDLAMASIHESDPEQCDADWRGFARHRAIQQEPTLADAVASAVASFNEDRIALWCHVNQLWDYIGLPHGDSTDNQKNTATQQTEPQQTEPPQTGAER